MVLYDTHGNELHQIHLITGALISWHESLLVNSKSCLLACVYIIVCTWGGFMYSCQVLSILHLGKAVFCKFLVLYDELRQIDLITCIHVGAPRGGVNLFLPN